MTDRNMKGATIVGGILIENDGDDECAGCESFAHTDYFTHDAIMDLSPWFHSIPPRSQDLCEYTKHELAYALGLDAPNYPVPAVIQHFEWGWNATLNQPALIHAWRGRYPY